VRVQDARKRVDEQAGERAVVRARADEQQHPERFEPVREMAQEPGGRRVGPLRVVDRNEQGRLAGKVRDQPVEPVTAAELHLLLRAADARVALEQRRGERRGTAQPAPSLLRARAVEHRLEQLTHDPVREVALEFRPACRQHPELRRPGLSRRGDQRRLADPRRSLDHHHRTRAGEHVLPRRRERVELARTLKQLGGGCVQRLSYPGRRRGETQRRRVYDVGRA